MKEKYKLYKVHLQPDPDQNLQLICCFLTYCKDNLIKLMLLKCSVNIEEHLKLSYHNIGWHTSIVIALHFY